MDSDEASEGAEMSEGTATVAEDHGWTEGPLAVWPSLFSGFAASVVVEDSDPLLTLAEVRQYRDAVLYAAAPDLYEALQLILPLAKGYAPSGQTATARATCNSWIEAAEAALSKAQGVKP